MRYIFPFSLVCVLFFALVWYQGQRPCQKPLTYDIGKIDPRHNLSAQDFLTLIKKGESIWEKSTGKNLFDYQKGGHIKVNLVYDKRQKTYDARKKESLTLGLTEGALESEKQKLSVQQEAYNAKLASYNSDVASWNRRGGAPPSVVASFLARKNELAADAQSLQVAVARYNDLVRTYNNHVADWNSLAGEETTAGDAKSTGEVNIYLLENSKSDAVLVAHELGHALGLNHVNDSKSIMYYRLDPEITVPSKSDLEALDQLCTNK